MHEVGHTLGLRHNFKASTLYSLDDMNDPEKTDETGIVASVMDYTPTNIVPKGMKQGDYYSHDDRPLRHLGHRIRLQAARGRHAGRRAGRAEEDRRPQRRAGPGVRHRRRHPRHRPRSASATASTWATTRWTTPSSRRSWSPRAVPGRRRRHDQGRRRLPAGPPGVRHAAGAARPGRCSSPRATSAACTSAAATRATKAPKPPFVVVRPSKQREALTLLEEQVFSDKPFSSRRSCTTTWLRRTGTTGARDRRARRLPGARRDRDVAGPDPEPAALAAHAGAAARRRAEGRRRSDAFTTAELIERLTKAIFAEVDTVKDRRVHQPQAGDQQPAPQPAADLPAAALATGAGQTVAPQDCQTIAYAELGR